MSSIHQHTIFDRIRQSAVAPWLCALLCVTTWRGPVPCVHQHDCAAVEVAEGSTESAQEALATTILEHLKWFHSKVERTSHLGWHLHILPSLAFIVDDASPVPTDAQGDPLSEFGVPVAKIAAESAGVDSPWQGAGQFSKAILAGECRISSPTWHSSADERPLTFLSSLLPAAPLRAITGIALC